VKGAKQLLSDLKIFHENKKRVFFKDPLIVSASEDNYERPA